jgi:hypothetical protein
VNALRATAVPIPGIGGGRIDVRAAAAALGVALSPAARLGTKGNFTRQVSIQTGKLGRTFDRAFTLGAGAITVILDRPNAQACTMILHSRSAAYLTWRSTPRELDISTRVPAGRYIVSVRCDDAKARPFSLSVNAKLPAG